MAICELTGKKVDVCGVRCNFSCEADPSRRLSPDIAGQITKLPLDIRPAESRVGQDQDYREKDNPK